VFFLDKNDHLKIRLDKEMEIEQSNNESEA